MIACRSDLRPNSVPDLDDAAGRNGELRWSQIPKARISRFGLDVSRCAFLLRAAHGRCSRPAGTAGRQTGNDRELPGPRRRRAALETRRVPASRASRTASLAADQVRISYSGHSTFLIESPGGVKIATDYNDYVRRACCPTS